MTIDEKMQNISSWIMKAFNCHTIVDGYKLNIMRYGIVSSPELRKFNILSEAIRHATKYSLYVQESTYSLHTGILTISFREV